MTINKSRSISTGPPCLISPAGCGSTACPFASSPDFSVCAGFALSRRLGFSMAEFYILCRCQYGPWVSYRGSGLVYKRLTPVLSRRIVVCLATVWRWLPCLWFSIPSIPSLEALRKKLTVCSHSTQLKTSISSFEPSSNCFLRDVKGGGRWTHDSYVKGISSTMPYYAILCHALPWRPPGEFGHFGSPIVPYRRYRVPCRVLLGEGDRVVTTCLIQQHHAIYMRICNFGIGNALNPFNLAFCERYSYAKHPLPFNFLPRLNRNSDSDSDSGFYLLLYNNTSHVRDYVKESAKGNCLAETFQQHSEEEGYH